AGLGLGFGALGLGFGALGLGTSLGLGLGAGLGLGVGPLGLGTGLGLGLGAGLGLRRTLLAHGRVIANLLIRHRVDQDEAVATRPGMDLPPQPQSDRLQPHSTAVVQFHGLIDLTLQAVSDQGQPALLLALVRIGDHVVRHPRPRIFSD